MNFAASLPPIGWCDASTPGVVSRAPAVAARAQRAGRHGAGSGVDCCWLLIDDSSSLVMTDIATEDGADS